MLGAIHLITALLLAAIGTGCVSGARVAFDEREDLSKYQTWDWLPGDRATVEATHANAAALDAELARLIEQTLLQKGFRRDGDAPDFYVRYELALRQHLVVVNEPRAIYQLSSHHSDGSYLIQASSTEIHSYSEMRLAISAVKAGHGNLWRGTFSSDERKPHALDEAVAMLLERFPRQNAANAAEERRRRAICNAPARENARPVDSHDGATGRQPRDESHPVPSCPRDAPDKPRKRTRPPTGPHIPA